MLRKSIFQRIESLFEAAMARLGHSFIDFWGAMQQRYRRVYALVALRLRYAFFPLLALGALGWLAWDWQHERQLASAEDAIFDQIIGFRPWEPKPSRKVVVVEIDECSIQYMRQQGAGGWPWSRQLHADLIDALDRAGVRAVGFDVQFADASAQDPLGDTTLDAIAEGGAGRFVFGTTRLHPDYDPVSRLHASQAPSSYPLVAHPRNDPPVALLLPYGKAMAKNSALLNVARGRDGVLRDVPLHEQVGDWALASMPLRLATGGNANAMAAFPDSVRIDWRTRSKLPFVSAADLLTGRPICRPPSEPLPALSGRTVLVGYTAAGLNDAKPTPAGLMPGVEVHAEATEALLAGSAIWLPPAWLKYALAALLLLLTTFAFFRGEPAYEIDDVFVATNLVLLVAAFVGLTAFRVFFDIFAAIGFVSLYFGLCRLYAAVQRGRAIGNNDFRKQFDPTRDRVLAFARVRFVPDPHVNPRALEGRLREYRRRLRRYVHGGLDAVMLDGVVERKSWLWEAMEDVTVLVWSAPDRATAAAAAERELDGLHAHLIAHDDVLPDDGSVHVAILFSETGDPDRDFSKDFFEVRAKVRGTLGRLLAERTEWPLSARNTLSSR